MRLSARLLVLALLASLLQGCGAVLVGGTATGVSVIHDRRSSGTVLDDKNIQFRILSAIEQLPDAFRSTVLLVNVEGLSYEEAAAALGVPLGTVHSRIKRGRTLLQQALWEQASDAGLIPGSDMKGCAL